jgi:type II secretory pathway pseudopilin PulG
MEAMLVIGLPVFSAVASIILAWFVMQSRMEVKLAEARERIAAEKGAIQAEREAMEAQLQTAMRAAQERAHREALDAFLGEMKVEQRHYTRENRRLAQPRKSLVLQERMYFRNIPLSDWIEHEIVVNDDADLEQLIEDMTVFEKPKLNVANGGRQMKALA